jgi:hypothetical protein
MPHCQENSGKKFDIEKNQIIDFSSSLLDLMIYRNLVYNKGYVLIGHSGGTCL